MTSETKLQVVAATTCAAAALLALLLVCRYVSSGDERANARAREAARLAPPPVPPPPPVPAALPPDLSKLVTARTIAGIMDGSTKPSTSKTVGAFAKRTFAGLPGAEATVEKTSPEHVFVSILALPVEGLGPSEHACGTAGDSEYFRITAGPLSSRYLAKVPGGRAAVMSEPYLRRHDKGCALESSCRSNRGLSHKMLVDSVLAATCQILLRQHLKAPKQAEFPDISTVGVAVVADCRMGLVSYVDAMNPYGVKMRTKYGCAWDPATDEAAVKLLDD